MLFMSKCFCGYVCLLCCLNILDMVLKYLIISYLMCSVYYKYYSKKYILNTQILHAKKCLIILF